MAQKIHKRQIFENAPSTRSPLNEDIFNYEDICIDQIDDRVVQLMGYEGRVSQSEKKAEGYKDLAESWAKGGTGERAGEDTNNSNYWSNKSKEYANSSSNSAMKAESAMNQAEYYKNNAFSATPDGYEKLTDIVDDLDSKVNTLISATKNVFYSNTPISPSEFRFNCEIPKNTRSVKCKLSFHTQFYYQQKYTVKYQSKKGITDYGVMEMTGRTTEYEFPVNVGSEETSFLVYLTFVGVPTDLQVANMQVDYTYVNESIIDTIESIEERVASQKEEQNVHFATGSEITVDTAKGGARFVGAKGGMFKSPNLNVNDYNDKAIYGITFKNNLNGTWTVTGTNDGTGHSMCATVATGSQIKAIAGHKYLIRGCPKNNEKQYYLGLVADGNLTSYKDFGDGDGIVATSLDSWDKIYLRIYVIKSYAISGSLTFKPELIDLTALGFETKEEFEKAYPNDFYQYGLRVAGDMGFFDGELLQGYWNNGHDTLSSSTNFVTNKNPISVKNGDEVSISADGTLEQIYIQWYDKNGAYISNSSNNDNFVTANAPSEASYFYIRIKQTPISPSTAPKITVTINGQYAVCVKEHNNGYYWTQGYYTDAGLENETDNTTIKINKISCSGGENLSIKFDKTYKTIRLPLYTDNGFIERKTYSDTDTVSLSLPSDCKFFACSIYDNTVSKTNPNNAPQTEIIVGSKKINPYSAKTVFVPVSQQLCEGNEIAKIGDKWYEIQRYLKDVVDGSENYATSSNGNYFYINNRYGASASVDKKALLPSSNSIVADFISDKYNVVTRDDLYDATVSSGIAININGSLCIRDTSFATSDLFKEHLQSNPITLYYRLATPIYVEITDQSTLYQLESYEGQTHITTADGLAEITVGYGKSDTVATALNAERIAKLNECKLNEIYSELTNALISMNGTV